jgi:hypothetical protein
MTKVRKTMMVILELEQNIHFDTSTFQMINFQSLKVFKKLILIQKFYFFYFSILDLRKEKWILESGGKDRMSQLTTIPTMKKD